MTTDQPGTGDNRRDAAWVLSIFVLAVLARSLDYERVLLDGGEVIFAVGDAFYHARRALYSFLEFPALLTFDPCINFPDGARVPHPPLLDWATAGVARLFGSDVSTFEHVAAWVPVALASAAVFPIAALGRLVGSNGVGLLAAGIYALLPIDINYGQLGNFDHHALAGLLGAWLVYLCTRVLQTGGEADSLLRTMAILAGLRAAMMLTWTGSLLYLVPVDTALLLAAVTARNLRWVRWLGASAGLSAVVVLPFVLTLGVGASGPYAAVELSRFHVLLYLCFSLLCFGYAALAVARPSPSTGRSLVQLILVAIPIAALSLLLPGVFAGIETGLAFLGASDGYTETVVEQTPIFWGEGRYSFEVAHARMGAFVYLIPIVPIAFWVLGRDRDDDYGASFLAGWTVLFGYLAVGQVRYAYDFAPAGCVGFALILIRVSRQFAGEAFIALRPSVLAAVLAGAMLLPSVPGFYAPLIGLAGAGARGELDSVDSALLSISGSQVRFAQLVAAATDDAGRCDPGKRDAPGYGILSHIGLGHALHYSAQRATPADPFGPYIGRPNFAAVMRFMESNNQHRAQRIMEKLSARYVATAADSIERPASSIALRLHEDDGSYKHALPHLGRFRLLTEGPVGGIGMSSMFGDDRQTLAPYKLFEFVRGAVIELQTEPGSQMAVKLPLKTPSGRRFIYRAVGRANGKGIARVRVPYANESQSRKSLLLDPVERVVALGPYMVRLGKRRYQVHVSEDDIAQGNTIYARPFELGPDVSR